MDAQYRSQTANQTLFQASTQGNPSLAIEDRIQTLQDLRQDLLKMQSAVNVYLTDLMQKEKAGQVINNSAGQTKSAKMQSQSESSAEIDYEGEVADDVM